MNVEFSLNDILAFKKMTLNNSNDLLIRLKKMPLVKNKVIKTFSGINFVYNYNRGTREEEKSKNINELMC